MSRSESAVGFSASSTGAVAFIDVDSADSSRLRGSTALEGARPARATSYDSNVSISPDGKQIAFDRIESDRHTRHIWTADPARGVVTLLNDGARDWTPVTSSDGNVAFVAAATIYLTRPSAIGAPEPSIDRRTSNIQTIGRRMGGS